MGLQKNVLIPRTYLYLAIKAKTKKEKMMDVISICATHSWYSPLSSLRQQEDGQISKKSQTPLIVCSMLFWPIAHRSFQPWWLWCPGWQGWPWLPPQQCPHTHPWLGMAGINLDLCSPWGWEGTGTSGKGADSTVLDTGNIPPLGSCKKIRMIPKRK